MVNFTKREKWQGQVWSEHGIAEAILGQSTTHTLPLAC